MPMNEEVRKAVALAKSILIQTGDSGRYPNGEGWGHVSSSYVMQIPTGAWQTIRAELTRLTEIADSVDPLVVRLGEATGKLDAHTKMLADCFRMAGADPDGNEDWRIAPDALRAVTDLRRDYDEVLDWQARCEAANALLRDIVSYPWFVSRAPFTTAEITAHLSEPRT